MTYPNVLADPLDGGNKPGDGPLHAGGGPAPKEYSPEADGNLPSTTNHETDEQAAALALVRDLAAGPERVRRKGPAYLPRNAGEEAERYRDRLERSVFHNFFGRTTEGLTGLVFRKDVEVGEDVPAPIQTHWENIDNAGTHGDVFCREVFEDALTAGHAAILVEYPNTGGQPLSLADEAPLRPYWVLIPKDDIVSWRTTTDQGREILTQLVRRERRYVPKGEFGDREQIRYRVWKRENGVVSWQLLEITKQRTVAVIEEGTYPTQNEIPIAEVTTSGRVGMFHSIPPLLDLAYLNVAHYQQWSDYATSIHMTCVPVLFGAGVRQLDDRGQPVVIGPNSAVFSEDKDAKLEYVTHSGQSLDACKQALDDLKADMGTLGIAMLAPQKRAAETAEAKRLDKATSDSALAVAARGLQDAIERALGFHANYLRLEDGGSVEVNRDFEGLLMEASVMNAYAVLVKEAGFPPRLVLEALQRGGRIPDDADLAELELEMAAGAAATDHQAQLDATDQATQDVVIQQGNPYAVVNRGDKVCVIKSDTGEVKKCYPKHQRAEALAYFRALEAAMHRTEG